MPHEVEAADDGERAEQGRGPGDEGPDTGRNNDGHRGVAEHDAADRRNHRVAPEPGTDRVGPVRARDHDEQRGNHPEGGYGAGGHGSSPSETASEGKTILIWPEGVPKYCRPAAE